MKDFANPIRWLGMGFLAMGTLTFVALGWAQIETFDPEELAGLVVPLLFMGAGYGMMRLSRRMRDDPSFEIGHLGGAVFSAVGAVMVVGGIVLTFQDPGGIALIVFGLVFLGAGWMARKLFVTPEGMKKVAVQSSDASVQHGFGRETRVSSTTYINVPEDATEADMAAAREDWQAEQIAGRDDWASGFVEQEATRNGNVAGYVAAGFLAMCVIMALIGTFVDSFFYLFAVFMGIVAVLLLVHLVLRSIRARKFGSARFHMDRIPVAPGETLTGEIRSEATRDALEGGQFTLTLSCKQVVRRRSNDRTHYRTTVLWSESQSIPAKGESALTVPVSFDLPGDQPSTTLGRSPSTNFSWDLEARAAAPGIDLVAIFSLPVFKQD